MVDQDEQGVMLAQWTVRATPQAIAPAREGVVAFARRHGIDEAQREVLGLAFSEAFTNAVRHAYPQGAPGPVTIDLATDGEHLTVRVSDRGNGEGSQDESLGLGLIIMRRLADRVEVHPGADGVGTVVLMELAMGTADAVPRTAFGASRLSG